MVGVSELRWLRGPLVLTYVFLYLPILVLVVMSFNASKLPFVWRGFSLRWYSELVRDDRIIQGLGNTLIVAVGATVLATVLGTLLAVGLQRYSRSTLLDAFSLVPAILPDLVLAIGLLAFFTLVTMTLGLTRSGSRPTVRHHTSRPSGLRASECSRHSSGKNRAHASSCLVSSTKVRKRVRKGRASEARLG